MEPKHPQTIFPKHIPAICHPNVNSTIALINDMEGDETLPTPNHQNELESMKPNSKTLTRMKEIGLSCEPFLHKSNLYKLQLENLQSDVAQIGNESTYTKRRITELTTLAKVFEMNYKYCIASESCPKRMNVLNRCFLIHKPELVKSLFQIGRHDLICGKEKRAVERCISRTVMNVLSDTFA